MITVVILKQQNTSPILTATFVVVMRLDWKFLCEGEHSIRHCFNDSWKTSRHCSML